MNAQTESPWDFAQIGVFFNRDAAGAKAAKIFYREHVAHCELPKFHNDEGVPVIAVFKKGAI